MTRAVTLSAGGYIMLYYRESCDHCGSSRRWVHSKTPEGKKPYGVTGDPEGVKYCCRYCGMEWPVEI